MFKCYSVGLLYVNCIYVFLAIVLLLWLVFVYVFWMDNVGIDVYVYSVDCLIGVHFFSRILGIDLYTVPFYADSNVISTAR